MGKRKKGWPVAINLSEDANSEKVIKIKIKIKVKESSELAGLGDTVYVTTSKSDKTLDELMNINNIESNGNK